MKRLDIEAVTDNLLQVQAFVEECLEEAGCPMKTMMQVSLVVEEVFVNIAHYAYASGHGMAAVELEILKDPAAVSICFMDRGMPYDPLKHQDPDVTLKTEDRQIGGLGIFMTKKLMDEVRYEYRDGQNILTLKKVF